MKVNIQIADIWPEWEVVDEIGSGSYGTVYHICRKELGKKYDAALKVIRIPQNDTEIEHLHSIGMDKASITEYFKQDAERIYREVTLMSQLQGNTNIVSYADHKIVKHENGIGCDIYIRMQLLTPISKYLKTHGLTVGDVLQLGHDLCCALEICEKNHILHRDIKPENIFISNEGDYKLGDFGVARTADASTMGTTAGTYTYIAPEVFYKKSYNQTIDLYSLGLVLYQYLNRGRLPFLPPFPERIISKDLDNALNCRMQGKDLPALENIPKELNAVICKACSFDSRKRYQTAADLKKALEEISVPLKIMRMELISPEKENLQKTDDTFGVWNNESIALNKPTEDLTLNQNKLPDNDVDVITKSKEDRKEIIQKEEKSENQTVNSENTVISWMENIFVKRVVRSIIAVLIMSLVMQWLMSENEIIDSSYKSTSEHNTGIEAMEISSDADETNDVNSPVIYFKCDVNKDGGKNWITEGEIFSYETNCNVQNANITVASSDENVLKVVGDNQIQAVGAGKAIVTASIGEKCKTEREIYVYTIQKIGMYMHGDNVSMLDIIKESVVKKISVYSEEENDRPMVKITAFGPTPVDLSWGEWIHEKGGYTINLTFEKSINWRKEGIVRIYLLRMDGEDDKEIDYSKDILDVLTFKIKY